MPPRSKKSRLNINRQSRFTYRTPDGRWVARLTPGVDGKLIALVASNPHVAPQRSQAALMLLKGG